MLKEKESTALTSQLIATWKEVTANNTCIYHPQNKLLKLNVMIVNF